MKLSSIQQIIEKAYPLLDSYSASEVTINGNKYQEVVNLGNVRKGIMMLKNVGIFNANISLLENTFFYSVNEDKTNINLKDFHNARVLLHDLMKLISSVRDVLNNLLPEVSENTVYIKMPDIMNLEDFKKTVDSFNKILTLTILDPNIGGEISFAGVEPGSNWYKVFVKTSAAVSLLGSLMWAGAVIYKKVQEGKVMEEYARERKLKNDHKEKLIESHKIILDMTIEAEAENLYKSYYENGEFDNEKIERLKLALKTLTEEIGKGAEINPALTAPEHVSNLFPDMKLLPMVESKIKKIEDK